VNGEDVSGRGRKFFKFYENQPKYYQKFAELPTFLDFAKNYISCIFALNCCADD